jgi:hypothetical protein
VKPASAALLLMNTNNASGISVFLRLLADRIFH